MTGSKDQPRTYPEGVTCWIDTERAEPKAASEFYGELFGWTFENAMPPDAPGVYLIAKLDARDVAAIGQGTASPAWNTYVAVNDADETATKVAANGGKLVSGPQDAGPAGRVAMCVDPSGAEFRIWQARKRLGAQLTNEAGTWNFSNLRATDPSRSLDFYKSVFGWQSDSTEDALGAMIRVDGYGDHLESTVDPDIRTRQAMAPPGFADVIGGIEKAEPGEAEHWHVRFTVTDRDESAAMAEKLGATVISSKETQWTYEALIRDPDGAEFTLSQFAPQDW